MLQINEKGLLTSLSMTDTINSSRNLLIQNANDEAGLICRYTKINESILRYWRFKTIYTIAGASGSGKSYMLNSLKVDLTDFEPIKVKITGISPTLIEHITTHGEFVREGDYLIRYPINGDYKKKVLFLLFGFDMSPEVEMIRTLAPMIGRSYAYLLSSEKIGEENGKPIFNKLTKEEKYIIDSLFTEFNRTRENIITIREPGTIDDMRIVIDRYKNRYHDYDVIVAIDHTLLISKGNSSSDFELVNDVSRKLKDYRDIYNLMIIPLHQFNNEIEDEKRRMNPAFHYPIKSDMYLGGQLFQSSDFVFTQFMPESLQIAKYGPRRINSYNIIHFGMIKSRNGDFGNIWLYNNLKYGSILSANVDNPDAPYKMPTLINNI